MKTELQYLVYVTAFTGLLWVAYILDRIATRGLHALAYTFGIPSVRTLAFTVGFLAQAAIAWQLLFR